MKVARFSKVGFILAAAGSAVGLGNIWKFPYMTGENGGGAFVLIYLLTITFIGVSLFLAEVLIGQISRKDAVSAFETLSPIKNNIWKYAGYMVFTGVLVLSFYTVVVGWIFKYIYISIFSLPTDIKLAGDAFNGMVGNEIGIQLFTFTIAFALIIWIVSKGVIKGIEKVNLVLMPALIFILVLLFFYAISLDGFGQAVSFLFVPDWSKVTSNSILAAVGQAFFTLSLGVGTIITYAVSLPKDTNLVKSSIIVAAMDTAIALFAGLIIFTFIFHFNAAPTQGAGLVFISLPPLFSQMGIMGNVIGFLFFVALAFAGITSAVSMIEPSILYLTNRHKMSRKKALSILGTAIYILGTLALLSNTKEFSEVLKFSGKGFFNILDFLSSSILMPLAGIMIAIFVGYFIQKERIYATLSPYLNDRVFNLWYFTIKYIIPIAVSAVMINKIFF